MPAAAGWARKLSSCAGLPALGAQPRGLETNTWMTCAPISRAYASAFGSPAPTKTWAPTGEGLRGGTSYRMSVDEQLDDRALAHLAARTRALRVHLLATAEAGHVGPQAERLELLHGLVAIDVVEVGDDDELGSLADLQGDGRVARRGA